MAISAYLADNGTTKAIWHDSYKRDTHECAWSSDNVRYALYFNHPIVRRDNAAAYGGTSYAGTIPGDASGTVDYYYAACVSTIGPYVAHRIGAPLYPNVAPYGNGQGSYSVYQASCLPMYRTKDTVAATSFAASCQGTLIGYGGTMFDRCEKLSSYSVLYSRTVAETWYARLLDFDEFSSWGFWKKSASRTSWATTSNEPTAQIAAPYSIGNFASSGQELVEGSMDATTNTLTLSETRKTVVSSITLGTRNIALRGVTDSRHANMSSNTTLGTIASSLLLPAHKTALSDTNSYDVDAVLKGRQSSTWTVTCASGYAVTGWYNAADDSPITSNNYYTVSSDGRSLTVSTDAPDTDVYALVQKESGILTATSNEGGTFVLAKEGAVTEAPFAVALGDTVGIMLSPEWNYVVSSVTVNGVAQEITDNVVEFTVGYGDVAVAVTFAERERRSLSITCFGADDGTVTLSRDGSTVAVSEDGTLTASVYDSVEYALAATPRKSADGEVFVRKFAGWYSDAEMQTLVDDDANVSVVLDGDKAYWAKFVEADWYAVAVNAVDVGGADAAGCFASFSPSSPDDVATGKFADGRIFTFTAMAGTGWNLYGWQVNDGAMVPAQGATFTYALDGADATVKSVFVKATYAFNGMFDSASADRGATITRQKLVDGVWTDLSDGDQVYHGDTIRLHVHCTPAQGAFLSAKKSDGTECSVTREGSYYNVRFNEVSGDISVTLTLGGVLRLHLHCEKEGAEGSMLDGLAEVAILDADGYVVASTQSDGGHVETNVPYGGTRKIRARKIATDGNFGFDGWYSVAAEGNGATGTSMMSAPPEGSRLVENLMPEDEVEVDSALVEYHAAFSDGDKSRYVKIRNVAGVSYGGTFTVAGGTVISASEYAAGKNNGFSTNGDPDGTVYVRLDSNAVLAVSVNVAEGGTFNQWTIYRVTPDATGNHQPEVASEGSNVGSVSFTYYVTADVEIVASYKDPSLERWLVVHGEGDVAYSPAGSSKSRSDGVVAAKFYEGDTVDISVLPPAGKTVEGLYEDSAHTRRHEGFSATIGASNVELWIGLADDTHGLFSMFAGSASKTLRWRSKMYTSNTTWDPKAVQVEADGYPVKVRVLRSSSPDAPSDEAFDEAAPQVEVSGERGRLLPRRRPERHVMIELESDKVIVSASVSTSMEGLQA